MTELTTELVLKTAAAAATNANAEVYRALGISNSDAPYWHDLADDAQATRIEVAKDIAGLPCLLGSSTDLGAVNIGLFVNTVRNVLLALGWGVLIQAPKPQIIAAEDLPPEAKAALEAALAGPAPQSEPVTVEATSEAQTAAGPSYFNEGRKTLEPLEPDPDFDWDNEDPLNQEPPNATEQPAGAGSQ